MGIYSRDYIRDGGPVRQLGGSANPWAIKYLIIANVVVFVLQSAGETGAQLTEWLGLSREGLQSFHVWQLLTYGFCHSYDIMHILFNMYVLWMFGRAVEPIYGSREFLAFFLTGVLVAGVCHVLVSPASVVGASGGVMAVVFLTAMVYPRMTVLLFFVVPIELRWLAVMYAFADVAGFLGSGDSRVANAAHLGGAAFGVAYKYFNWNMMRFINKFVTSRRVRLPGTGPRLKLQRPPTRDLEDQLDTILAKIHDQGEGSLTKRERQILKEASQKYKER